MNKGYLISLLLTTVVIPTAGPLAEHIAGGAVLSLALFSKWFIFSAGGLRLLIAGLKQAIDPAFTASGIFHLTGKETLPIVRELGFANICLGLLGACSLFVAPWRTGSALASGLYFSLAAALHVIRKPDHANERLALWSDILITIGLWTGFFAL